MLNLAGTGFRKGGKHVQEYPPHNSLNGLTPHDAYTGKQIDITVQKEKIKQAKQLRVIENQKNICCICQ